jgi:acylphosphatase
MVVAMRRVHVEVSGRVQGVFVRASCAERARALGLGGWVRNAEDGRVQAEFEGDPDAIAAIVDWCREGPAFADVERVDVRERPPSGARDFRVTR